VPDVELGHLVARFQRIGAPKLIHGFLKPAHLAEQQGIVVAIVLVHLLVIRGPFEPR